MSGTEFTSLRKAAKAVGVSQETIRAWCEKHHIGELRDGSWHISRPALNRILRAREILGRNK
jgi:transposase